MVRDVTKVLRIVFQKFENICHGGEAISKQDFNSAISSSQIEANAARMNYNNVRNSISTTQNQLLTAQQKLKSLEVIVEVSKAFKDKFNDGGFSYCSCTDFATSLNMLPWLQQQTASICQTQCPSGIQSLTFEIEEQSKALEREIDELE
jgi:hypothetical protein